jgi:hypothetical protein
MICTVCHKEFLKDWRKDKRTRETPCKFCSQSCANTRPKSENSKNKVTISLLQYYNIKGRKEKTKKCPICGRIISIKSKLCISCSHQDILKKTIGEYRNIYIEKYKRTNRDTYSNIRMQARRLMKDWKIERKCSICGYSLHVEVCHKIAINSFDDSIYISEINSKDNLIYLCRNHHWELDAGLLLKAL